MNVVRLLLFFLFALFVSCNGQVDDEENEKNFLVDPNDLGKITFVNGDLNFGPVPIGTVHERYILVKNTGKLAISEFESFYDDAEFSLIFRYSGQTAEFPGENGTCTDRLEVNQTCLLSISYLPTSSTEHDVEFKLKYKDGLGTSESTTRIKSLSGTNGKIDVQPDIVNFGDIDFNDTKSLNVKIKNTGELDLRIINIILDQGTDTLFDIDFNDPLTTCSSTDQILGGNDTCNLVVNVDTNAVTVYDDYFHFFEINFLENPTTTNSSTLRTDVRAGVYSLEGVLEATPILKYQNLISGSSKNLSFQLRNVGHNAAVIKTVNSPAIGDLNFTIDTTDCTNLSNEIFAGPGEVIIPPNVICILNATMSPIVTMPSQAFTYPNLNLSYDNLKTGIVNTPDIILEGNIIKSGFIETFDALDISANSWAVPTTIISNDSRISESASFKIKHFGDTPVTIETFSLSGQGSEYLSVSESCNQVLNVGDECTFNITLAPTLTVYNNLLSTLINSNLKIHYTDESIDVDNSFIQREIDFSISGNLDLKSELVFEEFDAGASRSGESVANSALLENIYIRNIGGISESTFSLQISNTTNYSIVNTTTVDTDGVSNCLQLIATSTALNPQDQCFFEVRGLSAVNGNFTTNLNIIFGATSEVSDVYALDVEFVDIAKIGAVDSAAADKVTYFTYIADYPGVGSSTSTADGSVTRKYSTGSSVATSQITLNSISTNFDLAVVDGGLGTIGSQETVSYNLGNSGEFPLGINSVSITSGSAVYKTTSGCRSGANISSGSDCLLSVDVSYLSSALESSEVEIKYTLGDKLSPDDTSFIEYTSYVKVYYKGYDPATVANLNPYEGVVGISDLELEVTVGPDNTTSKNFKIQNDGAQSATDIHYALLLNGSILTLTGGSGDELAFPDHVAGAAPIDEYLINNSGTCTNAAGNDMNVSGDCIFGVDFNPSSLGITNYEIQMRYFNGATYTSEVFGLKTTGLSPARLDVGEVLGNFPFYEYDFEGQVIDQTYTQEISLTNTGETDATNFTHELAGGSFAFEDNSTSAPTCGVTIAAGTTCYLNLVFNPVFANIGVNENKNFIATYETGAISGTMLTEQIEINVKGLTENIRSKHYGWDEVYSMGYNEIYADELNGAGGSYLPEDLGYISFTWFSMDDVDGDADRYFIYKSDEDDIDIYNDSPYDVVVRDGSTTYTYEDKNVVNTPLKVFYYKVVPEKNGAISAIVLADYPVANLRIVIPNKFESLVHKYMMNRDICKSMDITDTTLPSFDPDSNGCEYLDDNGAPMMVNHNYDFAVDMFETSGIYQATTTVINATQGVPIEMDFDNSLLHCESKSVTYSSSESLFSSAFEKSLPNRLEHSIYGAMENGEFYDSTLCGYDEVDPLTGNQLDCQSKFLIEQAVGGLKEWTTSQVSGFGRGESTTYTSFTDSLINNINYTKHFQSVQGINTKNLLDPIALDNTCLNLVTGIVEREGPLGCVGDHYAIFTDDPGAAGAKVIDISTEAANTRFMLWHFNSDLSGQNITVNAQAGGGESVGEAPQDNSSLYTTEFVPSISPRGGARCITRVGY